MQALRNLRLVRWIVGMMAASLVSLGTAPAFGMASRVDRANARQARFRAERLRRAQGLPVGLTQTPDAKLRGKIAARERATIKPAADARPLSAKEMRGLSGRGPLRNAYFNGTLPWQKSFRDVNLCNGNLFKSFTDVQVAPGRGAGLVLQRTYNSNDGRIGPFGVGWTHAYDIRVEESSNVQAETGSAASDDADSINEVPRTDFFGGKHTYHRDADGLYSPPAYLYDEMSSEYDDALVNGPTKVESDTEKGMDGTVKHYTSVLTLADGTPGNERACDSITDRHGNQTTLAYGLTVTQADGSHRKLLTSVTDPTGRALTFIWTNLGTMSAPIMRITEVDAPTDPDTGLPVYKVAYGYYTDTNDPASCYNLHTVTLDAGDASHLNRTTTYAYTSVTGTYYDQNNNSQSATEDGLLESVSDPLGHTVSYQYALVNPASPAAPSAGPTVGFNAGDSYLTNSIWVSQVDEPADGGVVSWYIRSGDEAVGWTNTVNFVNYGQAPLSVMVFCSDPDHAHQMTFCSDSQLRLIGYGPYGYYGGLFPYYLCYDNANNVVDILRTEYSHRPTDAGYYISDSIEQNSTYGPHGNCLTSGYMGQLNDDRYINYIPGYGLPVQSLDPATTTATAYYNASKYFAKQSVTDPNGHTTQMDYFADDDAAPGNRGEVAWVRDAGYGVSTSPSYQKQYSYTYNQYGQKTSETNLNGIETDYTYGTSGTDKGNLTQVVQDPGGAGHLNRTTQMTYDVMGRVKSSTDPAGQVSTFTYNSLGQPLTVHTPAKGSSPAETVTYIYGTNGRTDSVTDNRGTTTMTYETGCDRVSSITDPVTGTIGYTYRPTGERQTMTLPGGGAWTYTYEPDVLDPTLWGNFWDCVLPGPDPNGVTLPLRSITDDQGRIVTYHMMDMGWIDRTDRDQTFDTTSGALVSSMTTAYERASYSVSQYNGYTGDYQRDWLGQVRTDWNYQDTSGYGTQWRSRLVSENAYTYDGTGQRLTNTATMMAPGAGGVPQFAGGSPSYDSYGQVSNLMTATRTEEYGYDESNRLKTVDYGDGQTQSYAFDAMGNRTQRVDSAAGTTTYAFDGANRLTTVGTSSYTNDLDGNTLTGGGRTNTWDSQNRLVSCTKDGVTSAFTYGADGLRRSMTVNGQTTYYVYDGQTMVREMQSVGGVLTPAATYLTGPRGMEYRRDDGTGVVKWYVYDGLGSVVGELDPSGNLTCGKKYDVYGAERSGGTGTATSRQGFCGSLGHIADAETGLVYMRARYYDPNTGRFISEDPSKHGSNWLAYCSNNPVNSVDPDGKMDELVHDVLEFTAGCILSKVFWGCVAVALLSMCLITVTTACLAAGAVFGPGGLVYGGVAAYYADAPIIRAIGACAQGVEAGAKEWGAGGAGGIAKEVIGLALGIAAGYDLFMKADDYAQEHNR